MPSQGFVSFVRLRSPSITPRVTALACVAAFVASAACSGTTTGNGTGTSGGTGPFGGGTSGGTSGTTGTSGGTSGGTTIVPRTCGATASDTACTSCLKSSCCSQTLQCAHEPECDAVFNCANTCTSQQCTNDCIAAHPSAQSTLSTFITCEEQFCPGPCNGSSGSTSGGTSGSSGSTSPCQAAPDPTVCEQVTGKTVAEDCPGGSPSTQCVAAPVSGSNSIYCCPP